MSVPHVSGGEFPGLSRDDVIHRVGLTDCPWCGYEVYEEEDRMDKYDIWFRLPHIKKVILNNSYYKVGHCVVVSGCPKCRKLSWVHRTFDAMTRLFEDDSWIEKDPERKERRDLLRKPLDIDKIRAEVHRRGMEAINEVLSAICLKCIYFKGLVKTYDSFWVQRFMCGRDDEERERGISHFQEPDDCNAYEEKPLNT